MLIVQKLHFKILVMWEKFRFRLYRSAVLVIRKFQDQYPIRMVKHQEIYNTLDERSFNALYREMMLGFYKNLYWFCVANARFK